MARSKLRRVCGLMNRAMCMQSTKGRAWRSTTGSLSDLAPGDARAPFIREGGGCAACRFRQLASLCRSRRQSRHRPSRGRGPQSARSTGPCGICIGMSSFIRANLAHRARARISTRVVRLAGMTRGIGTIGDGSQRYGHMRSEAVQSDTWAGAQRSRPARGPAGPRMACASSIRSWCSS
jgi:hypothetical protein